MKAIPVYAIQNFNFNVANSQLYVNSFKNHLFTHPFVEKPHRHNFYLLVLFTHGRGTHDIDFDRYTVEERSLFVLRPGQIHNWKLSADCEGYIVFFSPELYDFYFGNKQIEDHAFDPQRILETEEFREICWYFQKMLDEAQNLKTKGVDKILNLLDTVLIGISRESTLEKQHGSHLYNHKIKAFGKLLEVHFHSQKSPSFYAGQMNISLKHLNRICKTILNKTATEIITARVMLEAKRLLVNPKKSVSQVADELGFVNYSYFSKLFKKQAGSSPGEFRRGLN